MKRKKKGYRLYLDNSRSVEKRVRDLLTRMTLEEKISQLGAGFLEHQTDEDGCFSVRKIKKAISDLGIRVLHNIPKNSRLNMEIVRQVQRYFWCNSFSPAR